MLAKRLNNIILKIKAEILLRHCLRKEMQKINQSSKTLVFLVNFSICRFSFYHFEEVMRAKENVRAVVNLNINSKT
jgi:hypothetical protein